MKVNFLEDITLTARGFLEKHKIASLAGGFICLKATGHMGGIQMIILEGINLVLCYLE